MHHLLAIRWVFFFYSLGSFLGKKLMALFWLWVCYLSFHIFSPHHTFPAMLPSLANLDPFSNLSCIEDIWCLWSQSCRVQELREMFPIEISGCHSDAWNREHVRALWAASNWESWPFVREDDCCGFRYLHNRPNSKAKRKIDFSHAPHFLSGRKTFPKSLPTQPAAEFPLCLIGQNWTYGHP